MILLTVSVYYILHIIYTVLKKYTRACTHPPKAEERLPHQSSASLPRTRTFWIQAAGSSVTLEESLFFTDSCKLLRLMSASASSSREDLSGFRGIYSAVLVWLFHRSSDEFRCFSLLAIFVIHIPILRQEIVAVHR